MAQNRGLIALRKYRHVSFDDEYQRVSGPSPLNHTDDPQQTFPEPFASMRAGQLSGR